jgi:hypothetical protein
MLSRALKAGSTFPPLATRTALTTFASMAGNASINVFSACCCVLMGRGGLGGGISVASSEKRTPGLGDLDGGGGEETCSAGAAGVSLSSSKSSSRAVVGDSAPEAVPVLVGYVKVSVIPYKCLGIEGHEGGVVDLPFRRQLFQTFSARVSELPDTFTLVAEGGSSVRYYGGS